MFMKEHSNIIALIYFQNARGQFRKQARKKCVFGFFPKQRTPTTRLSGLSEKYSFENNTFISVFIETIFSNDFIFSPLASSTSPLCQLPRGADCAAETRSHDWIIRRLVETHDLILAKVGKEAPRLTHTNPVKCSRHDMRQSSFDLT